MGRNFASRNKFLKSFTSLALAAAMLLSPLQGLAVLANPPANVQSDEGIYEVTLTQDQVVAFEELQEFNALTGVLGFEDDFALPGDDTQVPVLVFFENSPAPTQVIEAAFEGYHLPLAAAIERVEDNHQTFRNEVSALFASGRQRTAPAYHISVEYRHALNGVAMTLPADRVEDLAGLSTVRAIFPDFSISAPELMEVDADLSENILPEEEASPQTLAQALAAAPDLPNPFGMASGRARMNADELHRRGIDGEGIIIAIIDTGIDWMHPAFADSFPSAEVINEARVARFGPNGTSGHQPERMLPLTQNELFNINRYTTGPFGQVGFPVTGEEANYVFLGRDNVRLWPGGQGDDPRGNPIQPGGTPVNWAYPQLLPPGMPGNNPFECSPLYFFNEQGQNMRITYNLTAARPTSTITGANSTHGTHVAGTILGRPYPSLDDPNFNPARAIKGVAPGAYGIHYRGLYGHSDVYASIWVSAQEWAYLDGANVVNMSLGQQNASAIAIANISVNNIMLADPSIVFTISAGNSGANFFTGGNPGGSQMAITVSALTAGDPTGVAVQTETGLAGNSNFMNVLHAFMVDTHENGNIVFDTPSTFVSENGQHRILAMPVSEGSPSAAGNTHVPVGAGTPADFQLLLEAHEGDLEGAFVLVRRGFAFIDVAAMAAELGLGGVISVNGSAAMSSGVAGTEVVPFLMTPAAVGYELANQALENDGVTYFTMTELVGAGQIVQGFSSRGPLENSFEISPDIGSHGVNVFSAVPRWSGQGGNTSNWTTQPWSAAYGNMSGTSMSAPHLAGAVALLQHYSLENDNGIWPNYEIKTRIMNTAIALPNENYSPFDAGRNVDVLAATQTDSIAFVEFDRVMTEIFANPEVQDFGKTLTGSFSFGGFNRHPALEGTSPRHIGDQAGSMTMTAYLQNDSDETITYELSHRFITDRAARPAGSPTAALRGATLEHPQTLTVAPGTRTAFDVTINLPANQELGFHEGFLTITGGSHDLVLPFGAVTHDRTPAFEFHGLYRPVVTTNLPGQGAQNITSNELVMYFSQNWGFYADFYLIDAAAVDSGLTAANWQTGTIQPDGSLVYTFEDYILGNTMGTATTYRGRFGRHFPRNRGLVDETMRAVIFDGYYTPLGYETPAGAGERTRLDQDGDFFIGIVIHRQSPNATLPGAALGQSPFWHFEQNFLIPFTVDNTAPELTALAVSGQEVDLEAELPAAEVLRSEEALVLSGQVFDGWLAQAQEQQTRFGVWTDNRSVTVQDNLAIWLGVDGADPVRVSGLNADGGFEVPLYLAEGQDQADITLWLIDGYAPVPVVNQNPPGVGNPNASSTSHANSVYWNQPAIARVITGVSDRFEPNGFLAVDPSLQSLLRSDVIFGRSHQSNPEVFNLPAGAFNEFVWSGLNVSEFSFVVEVVEIVSRTVVSVDVDLTVTRENGNQNSHYFEMTQTIETLLSNGERVLETEVLESVQLMLPNNHRGIVEINGHQVHIRVQGNTDVRELYVVDFSPIELQP